MERENHVEERGLVPLSGGDVQVQDERGGAKADGSVRRDQSWYATHMRIKATRIVLSFLNSCAVFVGIDPLICALIGGVQPNMAGGPPSPAL